MAERNNTGETIRVRVVFRGEVQGVGFRYTACQTAAAFDVTGFVRNLPGGEVELVAEGDEAELDEFITRLNGRMKPYIADRRVERNKATGEFDQFGVRF